MRDSSGSKKYFCFQNYLSKNMTKKSLIISLATLVIAIGFLAPSFSPVYAQPSSGGGDKVQEGLNTIGSAYPQGARENLNVQAVVKKVIDWALYIAAIIAVIFIIIGGFMYITSAGDPGKAGKGRTTLTNALIGLAIIVLSYLIVQIVYNFLVNRI